MRCLSCIVALLVVRSMVHGQIDSSANKNKIVIRCIPSREQIIKPTLYLVFYGNKQVMYTKSQEAFGSHINPRDIKSINVLKGAEALKKYGEDGQFGVVETYLKAGKYPAPNFNPLQTGTLKPYQR